MVNKLIYILLVISSLASGQNKLEIQLNYADSLYTGNKLFDAVTEYKRLLFFDKKNTYAYETNYKIASAYKAGGFYDNAIKHYTKAGVYAVNDSLKYINREYILRCNILRNSTVNARKLLNELKYNPEFAKYSGDIKYWQGWIYIYEQKWDSAYTTFKGMNAEKELQNICREVTEKQYNVTFARVISYILPGSGQIYSGEYTSGILSLSWHLFLGYSTLNAFAEDRIFDGLVVGNLLWLRFYNGNIQNAQKFPTQKNQQLYNDSLTYLLTKFQGLKP